MEKNEILIEYGQNPKAMAMRLAEAAGLVNLIGLKSKKIGLKPNLVLASGAENGATTHVEIAEGLILYLREQGFSNIVILEGSWVGDNTPRAFSRCGYGELSRRMGVPLVDTQKDRFRRVDCAGLDIDICDSALGLDFLINLPVMKGHCQTGITCALKNNKGLISNEEKRNFHAMGLHRPIAQLAARLPGDFVVVDAICGDLDFEEGGNPVPTGMMLAARDSVLCDAVCARFMGYDAGEIDYIGLAAKLGVGCGDPERAVIRELSEGSAAGAPVGEAGGKVRLLRPYYRADAACSACEAALVRALARMESAELKSLPSPVCVGQGYQRKTGGLGVGKCTAGFENNLPGCPPAADEVRQFLRRFARGGE